MTYLYLKSLHIIFVVTWFAGIFYMVRLFIYTTESNDKSEPEKAILQRQLLLMQKRLWYIIAWPSAVITVFTGLWLVMASGFWTQPWMQLKILFVLGLCIYHLLCHRLYKQMTVQVFKYSSTQLRVWNEVATLFLFAIVFIVVLKSAISWIWGMFGLIGMGVLLMLGIRIYKKYRNE